MEEVYPQLKGHCVTHSHKLFSVGSKVANSFLLLISTSFHLGSLIPRRLSSVARLVAAIPYSLSSTQQTQLVSLRSITESSLEDTSKWYSSVVAEF